MHGSPHHGSDKNSNPLQLTEVDVDDIKTSRIHTVSEMVPELDLPGTPDYGPGFEPNSKSVSHMCQGRESGVKYGVKCSFYFHFLVV